jgi:hypothetical protein
VQGSFGSGTDLGGLSATGILREALSQGWIIEKLSKCVDIEPKITWLLRSESVPCWCHNPPI